MSLGVGNIDQKLKLLKILKFRKSVTFIDVLPFLINIVQLYNYFLVLSLTCGWGSYQEGISENISPQMPDLRYRWPVDCYIFFHLFSVRCLTNQLEIFDAHICVVVSVFYNIQHPASPICKKRKLIFVQYCCQNMPSLQLDFHCSHILNVKPKQNTIERNQDNEEMR